MMKNANHKDTNLSPDRILFVGTNEQVAKSAPNKGLPSLTVLTDVYTGLFCKNSCKKEEKWGIIAVNLNDLNTDMLAPSLEYLDKFTKNKLVSVSERHEKLLHNINKHKYKWEKSLKETGMCLYLPNIPSSAIKKVMIYNPNGKDGNVIINEHIYNVSNHKIDYKKNLGFARWLNGENVNGDDVFGDSNNTELENKLAHRYGLDVYYMKPVEKGRKSAAKKS